MLLLLLLVVVSVALLLVFAVMMLVYRRFCLFVLSIFSWLEDQFTARKLGRTSGEKVALAAGVPQRKAAEITAVVVPTDTNNTAVAAGISSGRRKVECGGRGLRASIRSTFEAGTRATYKFFFVFSCCKLAFMQANSLRMEPLVQICCKFDFLISPLLLHQLTVTIPQTSLSVVVSGACAPWLACHGYTLLRACPRTAFTRAVSWTTLTTEGGNVGPPMLLSDVLEDVQLRKITVAHLNNTQPITRVVEAKSQRCRSPFPLLHLPARPSVCQHTKGSSKVLQ